MAHNDKSKRPCAGTDGLCTGNGERLDEATYGESYNMSEHTQEIANRTFKRLQDYVY